MDPNTGISRRRFRRFMRTAPIADATQRVSGALSSNIAPMNQAVLAAATVMRATFSRNKPGDIQIDVHVSVVTDGYSTADLDLLVDGVPLDSSPQVTRNMIIKAVRACVSSEFATIGKAIKPERIAVQVFDGIVEVDGSTMMA